MTHLAMLVSLLIVPHMITCPGMPRFSLRSGPARRQAPSQFMPQSGCALDENDLGDNPGARCPTQAMAPMAKQLPRRRPVQQRQQPVQYGYYNPLYSTPQLPPTSSFSPAPGVHPGSAPNFPMQSLPEDDLMEFPGDLPTDNNAWCPTRNGGGEDVGNEPEELDFGNPSRGCPLSGVGNNNMRNSGFGNPNSMSDFMGGPGGDFARQGQPVLRRPAQNEVCRGANGLIVVRLLSKPSQVDMVCTSIGAFPGMVTQKNSQWVAAAIRKCAHDTEQVLVGGWYGETGCPSLVFSPRKGVVKKRARVCAGAVLCQM